VSRKTIETKYLELIAANLEMVTAEINDLSRLQKLLNAKISNNWPPPLNDEESMSYFKKFIEENPDGLGWGMWYFIRIQPDESGRMAVGNGGFKGIPSEDGIVEIGYSILPEFQKKGYATEAVNGLLKWAFLHPQINRVIAETLPELHPSIRVMEKNGFVFVGEGVEKGVIRYELSREHFEKTKI